MLVGSFFFAGLWDALDIAPLRVADSTIFFSEAVAYSSRILQHSVVLRAK